MAVPVIDQRVFQRPTATEDIATTDVQCTIHAFTCQPGLGSSEVAHNELVAFLQDRGYHEDWILEFELAAEEALSDACEHAPAGTEVHGLLLVVSYDGVDHVSVLVDNELTPGRLTDLRHLDGEYDFSQHLGDARGHGFPIMRATVDGMVISLVVDRMFWNVLEKEYIPAKK